MFRTARVVYPKVRAVLRQKGMRGQHIGKPPYGCQEDPEPKGYWIIGPEAAKVAAHIFELSIAGKGPDQIARQLEQEQALTTRAYYAVSVRNTSVAVETAPHTASGRNGSAAGERVRRRASGMGKSA